MKLYIVILMFIFSFSGYTFNFTNFTSGDSISSEAFNGIFNEINSEMGGSASNYIINGSMDFWQRGALIFSSGYTADRWALEGASSIEQSLVAPVKSKFSIALNGTMAQRLESSFVKELEGDVVSLSAQVNCYNSNYSSIVLGIYSFDDVDSAANEVLVKEQSVDCSTSFSKVYVDFTVSQLMSNNGFSVKFSGTAYVSQVMLGKGLSYVRSGGNYLAEKKLCQRYYENIPNRKYSTAVDSGKQGYDHIQFRVEKRVSDPSLTGSISGCHNCSNGGLSFLNKSEEGFDYYKAGINGGLHYVSGNAYNLSADAEIY